MNYIVKDCPCLDSDNTTCQDCTQDNPGIEICINRNNCIIKKFISEYDSISNFNQNMKEITKENEQLKIECDMYKTYYRAKHNDIDGKIFKYKEALEEIKQQIKEILE